MARRSAVGVLALGILWPFVARSGMAYAQTPQWTQTQIAAVNGAMPSIEVDRLGYVHVGWTLGLGGSSYYAYHATNTSGEYRTTLVDSKTSGGPTPYFPYLTTDSLGFFHMVWRDLGLSGSKPLLYRTNNPETRALVKMSFSSTGHTHDPLVDVTPDGVAHVVTEGDSCTGCPSGSNLYDESFTTTTAYAGRVMSLVQDTNDATGVQQFSSAVAVDGTRHMVFSMRLAPPGDNQRLIYYTSRSPGGATWSTPVSITGHQDSYQGWPAIAIDQANTLHVVYSSEDYGIYYVKHVDGGAWSTPSRINDQNAVPDAIPSIAIDPNGRLHVVFQRYAGSTVALYYTTNAYDPDNWLDPASLVLNNVGAFTLTHQNRKVAVNWVDGQVLVPYQSGTTMWLASTTDVPVTPAGSDGTSTVVTDSTFIPPPTLNRTASNTAATATTVMRFSIVDGGGDAAATRIRALHFHAGAGQSFTTVSGKDEVLSYLLAGAQVVTEAGDVLPALVSDTKIVVRDVNQALHVPSGATRRFVLQVWLKNLTQVVGKTVDLRFKADQDVVVEAGSSVVAPDQPLVESEGMLIVDNNAQCPTGTACNDGNPCTHSDMCNNANVCVGQPVTCNSDSCNMRTCNGTAACTATPIACGGGTGGAIGGGTGGGSGTGGHGAGGAFSGGATGSGTGGMMTNSGGAVGTGGGFGVGGTMMAGGGTVGTGGMGWGGMIMASGGAVGAGGIASGGGMMTASGGAVGTGGISDGGSGGATGTGSGGATGTGSGGATGTSSGGVPAEGGPDGGVVATGGVSPGGGGAAPTPDAATLDGGSNQTMTAGGCGCSVGLGSTSGNTCGTLALVLALAVLRRRRRK